jgi:hypothetical protein
MKKIFNGLILTGALSVLLFACKKQEDQARLTNGTFFTSASSPLTTSATTLVLDSTSGGTKKGITFTWPAVNYTVPVVVTYTLQIDSMKGNFSKATNVNMANGLTKSYTMGDFNTLVQNLGLVGGTAGQVQVRVIADIIQTGGSTSAVPTTISNVINLTITSYSTIPKPKYPVPDNLFLVGSATPGGDAHGWDNPVPVPTQQFTRIDANTFGMVIQLLGGKALDFLPVNGDWSHKYSVPNAGSNPNGDAFQPDAPKDIVGPTTDGLYLITVDFVKGTYTFTPATAGQIPAALFLVGDATPGGTLHGWDNPVPVPAQQFTQISSGEFKITIPLIGGASYLWLPVNGSWDHKFGGTSKIGGAVLADSAVPGTNTPAPDASGTYTIDVNFFAKTYTVK